MRVEIKIPPERIANLFTSAIEGGDPVTTARKGGWCSGIYWRSKDEEAPEGIWYADPKTYVTDLLIEVVELDEDTGKETSHKIERRHIQAGLVTLATRFPKWFCRIIEDNIDAPCADIFLQCVLFGEEKYA